ncbi:MAG: EAL domain-containing protein, partial [Wenzhouxiangellaceae bacterium]|nr:EAL domain-containing protein [Wenzhouxiangellaceae bacterium]
STSAIIWECEPERLEFLYVSAEIERILGDSPSDWVGRQRFHAERIHPDDRGDALDRLEQGSVNGRRCSFDVRVRTVDGRDVWFHNDVNPYLVEGEVVRLFGVMVDVTEQRRASRTVEYVSGLQRLLVEASHALIHPVEVSLDATLDELLARVGRYCDADRAYLIRFEDGLSLFTNTHEWTAPGINPEIENMQRESTDPLARMLESLKRREIVHLSDVAGLGDEWASERDMLLEQDILSLIVVPVYSGDELLGLVGFDSVRRRREWRSEEISLLQVLGDMVGASIGRSEAEMRLRHSESLRRTAEALARMGSWEWVIETNRFHASEEWRRVFGCHEEDLERDRVLELTLEEERPRVREALKRTVEEGAPYEIEHRIVRADDGEVRWVKAHAELRHAGTPQARLVGFAQDITERRDIERELFQLAHYDSLTGLPNRVLAADRLSEALKRARRSEREVGVLFLDLDHFKKVNDTMGHEAGDQTLCEAGRRVASVLRERDSVARLGGDEFVILVEGFDGPSALTRIAEKVLEQFRRPITVMGRDVMLTASIGIAVGPADGDTPGELIRNADTAMYHAKQEGRDGFQFFDAAMNEMIVRQVAIEQALHGVVERGELSIVYHPIVAIDDRGVRALEALLRWNHPELGDPSPDEFVPIAEQTGAIRELGEFVMRESLARVADWRGNGCEDLRVTVNVSPKQFRDAGFVDFVLRELARHGLPGEALELEITEGTLLTATRGVRKALMALEASGIGIVMDDFGTGFSSLSYLREYRFDTLKIDRRFVSGITERGNDLELVRSSIRLAQALDMTAVAEGVETEEQLALLREEGCQFAQGYLFGRPLDAEGVANLLAEREG